MQQPNYTQLPNAFIERMNEYETSISVTFVAICRKTIGWHKTSDRISLSQLEQLTGLSRPTVVTAIKILVRDGWITKQRVRNGMVYDLNFEGEAYTDCVGSAMNEGRKLNDLTTESKTILHTKETLQKKEEQDNIRGEVATLSASPPVPVNGHLAKQISDFFYEQAPDKTMYDFKREMPHCKKLADKARQHENPIEWMKALFVTYRQMQQDDKFYRTKPFLPSMVNAAGVYAQIIVRMENENETRVTVEDEELIQSVFGK